MRILLSILVLTLAALACGAPAISPSGQISSNTAAAPTPTPAPRTAVVGETVSQKGYVMTVLAVEPADRYGNRTSAEGRHFVAVEVLFESEAASGVHVNPIFLQVKDSDGYEYPPVLLGRQPYVGVQRDLPPGEKLRGWVTFEVPTGAHDLVLIFEPVVWFNNVRIVFDLGI